MKRAHTGQMLIWCSSCSEQKKKKIICSMKGHGWDLKLRKLGVVHKSLIKVEKKDPAVGKKQTNKKNC